MEILILFRQRPAMLFLSIKEEELAHLLIKKDSLMTIGSFQRTQAQASTKNHPILAFMETPPIIKSYPLSIDVIIPQFNNYTILFSPQSILSISKDKIKRLLY